MKQHKNITLVFSIAFIIALLVPNVVLFLGLDKDVKSNTNITFKTFPELNVKKPMKFIGNFKNYYVENHGLKKSHINNYISIKRNILHDDPIPNRVVKGKNDWYFLGNHYNNVFNDAYGNAPITEDQLQIISKSITKTRDYLKKKNIDFYVVIAPNKHTIYPEHLPFSLDKGPSRLDILNAYLNKQTDFKIIDLRSVISREKESQLYLKTDTHWNEYGAYLGYNAVMNEIVKKRSVTKRELYEYNIEKTEIANRDLDRMINLNQTVSNTLLSPKFLENKDVIETSYNRIHIKNSQKPLKVLMYRDSFALAWMDFFNETFGELVYLRGYSVKKADVEKEQPDIIILELIERNLTMIGT